MKSEKEKMHEKGNWKAGLGRGGVGLIFSQWL